MLTSGSRGDIQPFVALVQALTSEGFLVNFGAPPNHKAFIEKNVDLKSVTYFKVGTDTDKVMKAFMEGEDIAELGAEMNVRAFSRTSRVRCVQRGW